MQKLKVERINSRDFTTGDGKKFKNYSIASGGNWYQLKGKNIELVKEGDEIIGNISEKDYTKKDGTSGTAHIFVLIDPVIGDILKRIERIESILKIPQEKKNTGESPKVFSEFDKKCISLAKKDREKYDTTLFDFGDGKYKSARDIPTDKQQEFLDKFNELTF